MTDSNQLPPRINGERLWNSLMEMAKHGATAKGGVCRLALTDSDIAGRDLFCSWCRDTGLDVRVDQVGNILARRQGRNRAANTVATGSHVDSQPTGGKFDGVYGVLAVPIVWWHHARHRRHRHNPEDTRSHKGATYVATTTD